MSGDFLQDEEYELAVEELAELLEKAAEVHHEYEQEELDGERDEDWARFYAEFILERFKEFSENEEE